MVSGVGNNSTPPEINMTLNKTLTAVAAAVCAAACGTAAASDIQIYGNVATGLYYSHAEGGDDSLGLAAFKQTPMDTYFGMKTKETLGNGWYAGAQLEAGYHVDTGKLSDASRIADRVARVFIGNGAFEMSAGRMPNFTCATAPYSFYGRMRANQTRSGMLGPAPAFISFNTGSIDNMIAFASSNPTGFVYQALYSNGEETEETKYDWADNRHVGQIALGWVGERLRMGTVLSYERFSHVPKDNKIGERKDDAMGIHLIASYDMSPLTVSGVVYLANNERRIGNNAGLDNILNLGNDNKFADRAEGLDMQAFYVSAGYTMGPHYFAGSLGWLNAELNGSTEGYPEDNGSAFLGALVYYYSLSKRTQLYAFTSHMDGRKLLDKGLNFNQTTAGMGLMHKF